MRKVLLTIVASGCLAIAFAQNKVSIGTTTPQGILHIKSEVGDPATLVLETPIQDGLNNLNPLLKFKTGSRNLMWMHSNDSSNIFIGLEAGLTSTGSVKDNVYIGLMAGRNSSFASRNVALGGLAMENTSGSDNTAIGFSALRNGAGGAENTAVGTYSLRVTTGAGNTGVGKSTLLINNIGEQNTAVGAGALVNNTTGSFNTATGAWALQGNNSGANNTGVGSYALLNTAAAQMNTAIGHRAGSSQNNGWNNVFVGANTDVDAAGYFNVIAIGQGTIATASSMARFGNSATTSYGGWAGWSNISDGRFKSDVQANVPGLEFIMKLKPVTYHLEATKLDAYLHQQNKNTKGSDANEYLSIALKQKEKILYTGFIAQEVEKAALETGFDFSGVDKPKNDSDTYGLRYAEFVVPLVKAVQELKEENEALKKDLAELKKLVEGMRRN